MLDGVAEPSEINRRIAFHRLKAAIASGLNEGAAAATEMRAALELAPGDAGLLLATAAAELQAGRFDDALGHARQAGNTGVAQELIGDIEEKRGQFVDAARAYQAAMVLAPDREQYRIALALELVQHQTFALAIAVLEQAAPLFPKSAKIRTLLGIARYAADDIPAAIAALSDAIAIDPKLEPAHVYLSRIVLDSSAAPPRQAVDSLCGWDAIVCSALRLRIAHERADAVLEKEAVAGLKRAPADNAIGHCELGRAYEWEERWTNAREEMEACVRLDPSPQNRLRLGRIYSHLGLSELARQEVEKYKAALQNMSEESARRLSVIQGFEYTLK
jgi:tetratricopeptide (TPR) repeat protein